MASVAFGIGVAVMAKSGLDRRLGSLGELGDGSGWLEGSEWLGTFAWVVVHNGDAKSAPTGPNVVVVSR